MACWQNGFAFPSLSHYLNQLGSSKKFGAKIDRDDWRFKPRFRWFQTAGFGETISVPPGEIRLTIIPKRPNGLTIDRLNADQLFDLLTTGGPSTLALVSGRSPDTVIVDFGPLRSLICRVPRKRDDTLPDWGDASPSQFRLESFKRIPQGDTTTLPDPSPRELSSRTSFTAFLNRSRGVRAAFQSMRLPSSSDGTNVRFDLLPPGWYVVNQLDEDGGTTLGIPIIDWEHTDGVSTAVLADGKIKGVEGAFELVVSDQGVATFRSDRSDEQLAKQAMINKKRTDLEKLRLVQTLRREIETTMSRMIEHRKRLMALESKLLQTGEGRAPGGDPFGSDPFGGDPAGGDPFGGDADADPFDGDSNQMDPFGPGSSADADPFG